MIKFATKKFVKRRLSENDSVDTFYVKTDEGKACSIVCSRTKKEITISFITCIRADTTKLNSRFSSVCREIAFDRYKIEKIKDGLVLIYSRRYAPEVAYLHREKNITKTINDGLNVLMQQSNRLNIKNTKEGDKNE